MSLTPEERKRIYEEEKTRLEAQEKIKAEIERKKKTEKSNKRTLGCLVLIGIVVLLYFIGKSSSPTTTTPTPTTVSQHQGTKKLLINVTKNEYSSFANWVSIEGTVKNVGTEPIFAPTVIGEVYAKNGTLLGQDTGYPAGQMLSNMAPGLSAGFSMLIPVKGGQPDKVRIFTKDAEFDVVWPK